MHIEQTPFPFVRYLLLFLCEGYPFKTAVYPIFVVFTTKLSIFVTRYYVYMFPKTLCYFSFPFVCFSLNSMLYFDIMTHIVLVVLSPILYHSYQRIYIIYHYILYRLITLKLLISRLKVMNIYK